MDTIPPYFPVRNEWKTIAYSFTDNSGRTLSGEMSDTVEVILLPRAFEEPGTAPGGTQLEPLTSFLLTNYPQHNFIKGHMWNQEVGGKGETNNLVPLTSRANSAHKNNAESPLKEALRSFESYYANNSQISQVYGFQYRVEIQNPNQAVWLRVREGIIPNAIYVKASPIEYDVRTNLYDNNNSIIQVIPTANKVREKIEALNNGIWIDQDGNVTPA
ncbi:MAG: hypothetical protein MUE44_36340 [Oscillatoriaceae cyanobacterium Prado104]|jgi:hypothetical protein|nr:hypothetical protein [Oscillatoriaceae cyanobacterium Prado104]